MFTEVFKIYTDFPTSIKEFITKDFSNLSNEEKQDKITEVISISSKFAAGIAPIPIPIADIFFITPIQIAMVRAIGNINGYKLSEETVKEIIAVIGGGILGQQICLALFKIGLPGAGGIGGAAFVWVWTNAMGKTANHYFKNKMKLSPEEIEAVKERFLEEAKNQQQEERSR